eukprot:7796250-Heterocapsa_arctica.AAC.1
MGDLCVEATGPTVGEIDAEPEVAPCVAIFDVIEATAPVLCDKPFQTACQDHSRFIAIPVLSAT